jgi:cellulose synthase/poly-beta-1,6-N-acetylglucosamine synthase-like glycosyltransferase
VIRLFEALGLNFEIGFVNWLFTLTIFQVISILVFAVIDVGRNIGKIIALTAYNIKDRRRLNRKVVTNHPKITLLVPAHNESVSIKRTIISILENNYPNKEIIIIDDHSSDDTFEQASEFAKKGLIRIIKRKEGKGSKAAAINFGAVYATGDILMIMDGDTLIERNVLKQIAKYMDDPSVGAVAGNVRILSGDNGIHNILTKCQSYEYVIAFELGRRVRNILNILVIIPGAFGAFRKDLARKAGLYDKDTITEDFDLTIKVFKTGQKVLFISEAIAWTFCPNTWKGWYRQRLRWTHGQMATLLKHKDVLTSKNVVYKNLFVLAVFDMLFMDIILIALRFASLIWIVFFGFTENLVYAFILLMIVYLFNELLAFLASALFSPNKDDLKYVYLLPFIFLVYRPAYAFVRIYAIVSAFIKKDIKW